MAKKEFQKGINALFPDKLSKKTENTENTENTESLSAIYLKIPKSLKVKMGHYCTDNGVKQQDLIIKSIENALK